MKHYVELIMLLQQEWQFFQSVTPSVGTLFKPLEVALRYDILPDLLGGRREVLTDSLHKRTICGGNRAVIGIPYPIHTPPANFDTL